MSASLIEMEAVAASLSRFPRFCLAHHVNPDGDCLGSAVALALILRKMGKEVTILDCGKVPARYRELPGMSDRVDPTSIASPGVLVALDCGDLERMGPAFQLVSRAERVINIDHHASNPGFGDLSWVDPKAAAVGEMIFDLTGQLGVVMDKQIAIALYTAITTDTGSFRYDNTTPRTHLIASQLLGYGIPVGAIAQRVFDRRSLTATRLIGTVLNRMETYLSGRVVVLTVLLGDLTPGAADDDETDGLINLGRNIDGVDLAMLLKESPNQSVKVGFRSSEAIDVAALAKGFGGGGHARAAGCTLPGTIAAVKERLLDEAARQLRGAVAL